MNTIHLCVLILLFCSICPNSLAANNKDPLSEGGCALKILISPEIIDKKIKITAQMLDKEYCDKELIIIMIMKGSICFVVDLLKELTIDPVLEYVQCGSYGKRGIHRGKLTISNIEKLDITSKHVLLVDDIIDSGTTLRSVVELLKEMNPASLKTLVLLDKQRERENNFNPDWSLFKIEDKFVVGYGLDYKEHYRGLKGIYVIV